MSAVCPLVCRRISFSEKNCAHSKNDISSCIWRSNVAEGPIKFTVNAFSVAVNLYCLGINAQPRHRVAAVIKGICGARDDENALRKLMRTNGTDFIMCSNSDIAHKLPLTFGDSSSLLTQAD